MESLIRFSDVRLAGVALLSERANGGTGKRIEGVKRGVQGARHFVRRCCFVVLVLPFPACANLADSFETTPFLREQITGDTWRACLAREYQFQARAVVRADRQWADATTLAAKGRAALDGPNTPGACDCAKADARREALLLKEARGAAEEPDRAALAEAQAACAKSR
jgi:hypothetical protein